MRKQEESFQGREFSEAKALRAGGYPIDSEDSTVRKNPVTAWAGEPWPELGLNWGNRGI